MKNLIFVVIIILSINVFASEKLPDFSLQDLNGKQVKISDFIGEQPVIIDFWATWCAPCLKELPKLDKMQKQFGDSLLVIAISTDKPRKKNEVKKHIKSQKFKFTTLLDTRGEARKLLNIKNIPFTLLIDKNGEIVYDHLGYNTGDEKHLEEQLMKLYNAPQTDEKTGKEIKTEGGSE